MSFLNNTFGIVLEDSTPEVRGRLACVSITFVTSLSFDSTDIGDATGEWSLYWACLFLDS